MTTADFMERYPRPWRWVMNEVSMSLLASNGQRVGYMRLTAGHAGIPQFEYNRHVKNALDGSAIPIVENTGSSQHEIA